jgi:hypothetical protein
MFSFLSQRSGRKRSAAFARRPQLGIEALEERQMLSVGHITSAIGPRTAAEQQAEPSDWISTDQAHMASAKLDGNRLSYGFWTQEERPIEAWRNFRDVVARLQADRPEMEVYAYVGSPRYAKNGTFRWSDNVPGDAANEVGRYDDYKRWAQEIATLSLEFPIVKGILFDDFDADMQRDNGGRGVFTPAYVESIRAAGRSIAPNFRLEAIQYLTAISAYDAKRFERGLDAVHFFYRHGEGPGGIDVDPDRIADEIEMFSRAYSATDASPLATIYRLSDKKASKGDSVSVQATIDLNQVQSELVIAHFDTIRDTPSSVGFVYRRVSFNDVVVYEGDLAASAMEVQKVTITADQIAALKAKGKRTVVVKMELIVLKKFDRWSYAANIFIMQPEGLPVTWTWKDSKKSHTIVTGRDLETAPARHIGLYALGTSFVTVTPEYTRRILDHARAAAFEGEIEGISVWEVALVEGRNPSTFAIYEDYFAAVSLDRRLDLFGSGDLQLNREGGNEKWMQSKVDQQWYYILPTGELYRSTDGQLNGQSLGSFDPIYYAEPDRLHSAAPPPNLRPVVNAGPDRTVIREQDVILEGVVSDDGPASNLTYRWSVVSGPDSVKIANPSALRTTAEFDETGTYVMRLSVSDGRFTTFHDFTVVVTKKKK